MKNYVSFLVILFISIYSCKKEPSESLNLEDINWLLGEWIHEDGDKISIEKWTMYSDSLYLGEAFVIHQNDTLFLEKIKIQKTKDDVFYIPTVSNQNKGKPVYFKLNSSKNKTLIFENFEHDFPQRIVYSNPTADSLHAYIDGKENDTYKRVNFRYIRKK